ncbi:MAG: 5-(carboxyamino)imidazole ribonucleotide mutase [Candidatus Omnitrophota bacterium]
MNKCVAIVMGSESDLAVIEPAFQILDEFKIGYAIHIISAHRCPEKLAVFTKQAKKRGVKVIIAAAGGAAALPGVIAAHTILPVIGIPVETKALKGIDSLLSIVQMPSGVPVGCMALGKSGAKNAALFALEILALADKILAKRLLIYKRKLTRSSKINYCRRQ